MSHNTTTTTTTKKVKKNNGNTESARVNNTPVMQAPMSVERAMRIIAEARDARKALAEWKNFKINAEPVSNEQLQALNTLADLRKEHKRIYTLASAQMRAGSTSARTKAVALGIINATNEDNADKTDKRGNVITLRARAKSALGNALRKCGKEYYNTLAQHGVTRTHVLDALDTLDANTLNGLRDGIGWQALKLVNTATAAALKAHSTRK